MPDNLADPHRRQGRVLECADRYADGRAAVCAVWLQGVGNDAAVCANTELG